MKLALVQQNYKVGDTVANSAKIRQGLAEAHAQGARLVVLAEKAVTGTPLMGLAQSEAFLRQADKAKAEVEACAAKLGMQLVTQSGAVEGLQVYCSAVPFRHGVAEEMREQARNEAQALGKPVVWVNPVGAQTGTIYYGGSGVAMPTGEYFTLPLFEEAVAVVDTDALPVATSAVWGGRMEQLHAALVLGVRDYFAKTGCRDACIALSGGIDSALVMALGPSTSRR